MSSSQDAIPETPRVISPSPAPSETRSTSRDGYAGPTTRSAARRQRLGEVVEEDNDDSDPELNRSRTPSRKPKNATGSARQRKRKSNPMMPADNPDQKTNGQGKTNGYLSPIATKVDGVLHEISRSPSPLGLIPLHARYRSFIHRHEIPRKLLHVSIGFLTLHLYSRGIQTLQITPWLFSALVPIAATDLIRHRSETVNKLYIRCVGALMRETEVSGYNGVIWYLLGAYTVLRFFPKDVGVMGVLLLSWCDTAASTFGRLYGRYTFSLRKGKSFAGTLSAWLVGVITAAAFWGYFVPHVGPFPNDPEDAFMFTGRLNLIPDSIKGLIGWTADTSQAVITGPLALGVMSVVSGLVAAGSEFVDLFGWDDNFTIPILSGVGLWGFLKVFG
ncbi:putative phosphatidate cytidylyltransferase [Aspergillus steynii IBT 23096]|uniref:Putative phosphatidate cytidylyltransferase n=1 Tax=Aspergillus steynii IBT 23096 TaxID=1392250 RepID=A0A2I2GK06_9EURO|nr:putative phosphatidate cytidylyltransferase [Aspergillus steynii IBT 23096]PLB53218.1 putative phosphatidate cytidylyltransferase [Aspergillus steynii IBT 23096]